MSVLPKKGGKCCVCVDYIDLNEACPKDCFPLPYIDQIVDATARHGILSFLDAFSEYHQRNFDQISFLGMALHYAPGASKNVKF